MTKKYSSFKDQQKITESFRKFIGENETGRVPIGNRRHSDKNVLTITPEKIAKIATREFSDIDDKDRTADLKAWRGKNADRFPPEGDITPAVWKIIKEKSKAWLEKNKTKKENKVRFTKRQLQKIIKEEIKKTLRLRLNEGYNMGQGNPDYVGGDSHGRPGGLGSDESKRTEIEDRISTIIAYFGSVKGQHEWNKIHKDFRSAASVSDRNDRLPAIQRLKKNWGAGANWDDWEQEDFQAVLKGMGDEKPLVHRHGDFNNIRRL